MEVSYLNLDHYPRFPDIIDEKLHAVTVKGLGHSPLFSLEKEYRDNGYDVYLRHGYNKGEFTGLYRPPGTKHGKEAFIPLVYNWQGTMPHTK